MAKFARTTVSTARLTRATIALLALVGCGDPAPTSTTTTAPAGSASGAGVVVVGGGSGSGGGGVGVGGGGHGGRGVTTAAPRPFADELRGLLALAARHWPVTSEHVVAYFEPRAKAITRSDAQLSMPAWARRATRPEDLFVTLGGEVAGAAIPVDDRGHGLYVHLYVPGGTRAEVEAVLGPLRSSPPMPGAPSTALAYPEVAGHRLRVIVEEQAGQRLLVNVHFEL